MKEKELENLVEMEKFWVVVTKKLNPTVSEHTEQSNGSRFLTEKCFFYLVVLTFRELRCTRRRVLGTCLIT